MLADSHGNVTAYERNIVVGGFSGFGDHLVAAQHRADACQQLTEGIRFGDVVVRADFKADDLVDFRAFRVQHDYRHTALLADPTAQRGAVKTGQHQIEQHQIDTTLGEQFQSFFTGGRGGHVVPFTGELVDQRLTVRLFVLDDQNSRHQWFSSFSVVVEWPDCFFSRVLSFAESAGWSGSAAPEACGIVMVKVDPSPSRDHTEMVPPQSSTQCLVMANPRPVPPVSRERAGSTR